MTIEMAAEFWQIKELEEHIALLQAEVTASGKFEAWKKGQKARREKNKKAVEEVVYMMESLRQMGLEHRRCSLCWRSGRICTCPRKNVFS